MKLFLRDQFGLLLLTSCQFLLLFGLLRLSGYENWNTLVYAFLLCTVLLVSYLFYRYYTLQTFYRRLSEPFQVLDESIQSYGLSAFGEALTDLLHSQYRSYQEQLLHYKRRQERHLTFTQQWVHQMKTPLSIISLITQDEDDARFTSLREEAERLQDGLEMVLYTARLETFEKDFHVEPVELLAIVQEVIQENKRLFIRNAVYPEVRMDTNSVVISDKKWLVFILDQLITNAVKYSAGVNEKIYFVSSVQDDRVELVIQDLGIGIPSQDLPRIFDPYFTGENGRSYRQSTGMGLFLVREACQQLGHTITVTSEVGKGTAMRLALSRHAPNLALL